MQEIIKIFRDHGMDHKLINKSEMQRIIKEINNTLMTRFDTDELNFIGF